MKQNKITPFIKWAGGKTQLLDAINALLPTNYKTYHEPFVGGGAVIFDVLPSKATINDLNKELIDTYNIIKSDYRNLIKILRYLIDTHNSSDNPHDFYYKIRDLEVFSPFDRAVRFIYLNKTGFNGLYRVNSSGKFNVPYGKKDTLQYSTVFSETNLKRLSNFLSNSDIKIFNRDFSYLDEYAQEGDFIFVDSPYDQSFVDYTKEGFNVDEHKRLAELLKRLDKRGVQFMLTNNNTPLINELYKEFQIFELPANRSINSDGKNRSNSASEIIVINYRVTNEQLRNFEITKFFKQLKPTSYVLSDYVNWEKIKVRLRQNELLLNDLNYLFSSNEEEFEEKFESLYRSRQECFAILPLLIAVRSSEFVYLDGNSDAGKFNHLDKENVKSFLRDSGLRDMLFINHKANKNMQDYYLGLEVGLTSADKKNLSGSWANKQVEFLLNKYQINFTKEVSYNKVLNINLQRDKDFDYVFKIKGTTYCLEVNFFNTSGSKINSETARFEELDRTFDNYSDLEFIWVTDGIGLKKHQTQIKRALSKIDNLFNFVTFEKFLINQTK